jgi:iron complex outermembrane receptor protein|tara:strand:- start:9393 stop:11828 length:2436 start_codon:yes stop_codon:yes gene_type:complete
MKKQIKTGAVLCASAASLVLQLLPAAAIAQEEAKGVFEEVLVTARKRTETAQRVPIPITALSQEQLQTRNMTEIRDIERLSPNTSIQYSSVNGTAAQIFMRGIGQTNWSSTQDPKIGMYVDGVYLSRPQGGLLDFMDIERVEVLRGPQGTLFGRNTTAGLIHIINNKPSQEFEADVQFGIGNENHQSYGFMVNTPITNSLAARFALYDKETDGNIINSVTGKDRGNENSLSYRGSLLWDQDDFSAQFTFDHFEADERAPLGTCRFTGADDPFAAQGLPFLATIFGVYGDMKANCESTTKDVSIDNTNNESAKSDVDAYTLRLGYDFEGAELTSITSLRKIDNFNGSWGWVMGNGPNVNLLEILNNKSENEIFSQELRLTGSTDNLSWVVGAYLFKEESEESLDVPLLRGVTAPSPADWPFFYAPSPAGGTVGDSAVGAQLYGSRYQAYDVVNKNKAVFAEATYTLNDRWDVTLGARYTEDEREFTRIQTLFGGDFDPAYFCPGMPTVELAPGVVISGSDRCFQDVSYDKITPRAIVNYQLNDDVMFYASYSVGYSSGGFNQDVRMRAYEPEVSDNYEFGFKSEFFNSKLRVNASAFINDYQNQQLTVGRVVNGQATADLINAQEAQIKGLELEVLGQLTDALSIAISAGYIEGDYKKFTVDDNAIETNPDTGEITESIVVRDLSDVEFGNNGDELSFDVSLLHIMDLGNNGDITSSLGYSYKDDQYSTLRNTPSSFEPSYWLLDSRVTWNLPNGKTHISLWGTNLTDEEYVDTQINQSGDLAVGGTDPSLGMTAVYWGAPQRFGLEVRHTF